jgi:isopentenyl diphosphate isomerase/L-lactate dehydrogenase-like FMN-dependent dehydrogenase
VRADREAAVDFANYQYEIYFQGLAGVVPQLPASYDDLEARAREELEDGPFGYVAGGASSEDTVAANREAFRRWRIVPRMLVDIDVRDLSTQVLGQDLVAPVALAPVGVQSIVHPDAEVATARAASSVGIPFTLSTVSSKPLEEVAEAAGDGPRWFQLYWPGEVELAASLMQRAKAAGYTAVFITLDTKMLAWRPRDIDGAYLPFLVGEGLANYTTDPVFTDPLEVSAEDDLQAAVLRWAQVFLNKKATWDDLASLREHTDLPLVLKGVLHPDDARRAVDHGMDGIVVSNHGGRQVDGELATLDALPDVAAAVDGQLDILFDSGIRTGADVVKAVALGAKAVLLGRPYVWGLALGGEDGVRHVVRSLLADLDLTMAMSGFTSLADLEPGILRRI